MRQATTRLAGAVVGVLAAVGGAVAGWHAAHPILAALAWALSLTGTDAARAITLLAGAP